MHDLIDSAVRVAYPRKLFSQLCHVEDLADRRGLSPPERLELRQQRSSSIMDRYHRWLIRTVHAEPPAGALAKACSYSLNH